MFRQGERLTATDEDGNAPSRRPVPPKLCRRRAQARRRHALLTALRRHVTSWLTLVSASNLKRVPGRRNALGQFVENPPRAGRVLFSKAPLRFAN
jgi:hypothetical protein